MLRELGIVSALLHAGASSIYAIGAPSDKNAWSVAISHPCAPDRRLAVKHLRDNALSVSGVHGRGFIAGGRHYGHVMAPRTGWPTRGPLLAAVTHASPTIADAFSTAALDGDDWQPGDAAVWRCEPTQ